jgi:adenylate cyclase
VRVKGKNHAVRIFMPLDVGEVPAWVETFQAALAQYRTRDFAAALAHMHALAAADNTAPSELLQLYITRCQAYLQTPPPADWDGTAVFTKK